MINSKGTKWGIVIGITAGLHLLTLGFILRYTTTFPLAIDEWIHILPRSVRMLENRMTWEDFIAAQLVYEAPPVIYLYPWSFIAPNVAFLDWNLQLDSVINYILATLNTILVLTILVREQRQLLIYLVIPVTAFLMAIQQRWNFLVSIHHIHHQQIFFFLMTMFFAMARTRWGGLAACSMAFFGSFALPTGWAIWIVLLPFLVLLGYRNWFVYMAYGIGILLTVILLSLVPGYDLTSQQFFAETATSPGIVDYVLFTLAYLGGIFGYGPNSNFLIALLMGSLSCVVFLCNALFMWRTKSYQRYVTLCLTFGAYGGMFGTAASIGRIRQFGVLQGMAHQYMIFSAMYWVGLTGLIALTLWHYLKQPRHPRLLITLNLAVILLGVIFYIYGVLGMLRFADQYNTQVVAEREACIQRVAMVDNPTEGCEVVGGIATPEMIKTLYQYRLTGFATID